MVFHRFMLNIFDYISCCVSPILITYMCIYRYWSWEWYQLLYSYYSYHIANNFSINFVYSYGICVAAKSKQTPFLIGDYLLKQVLWPMNTVRTVYLNKINYMCFWWLWTDLFTYLFYSKQLPVCSGLLFIFVVFSCFILCNAITHCYCCNAIFD